MALALVLYSQEILCFLSHQSNFYTFQTTRQCIYVFFEKWIRPILNENCFDHCFVQLFYNFNFFTGCSASIIMYPDIFWYRTFPKQIFNLIASNNKILCFCGDLFLAQNLLREPLEWCRGYIGSTFYLIPLDHHLTDFLSRNWLAEITYFLTIESISSRFLNKCT